MYRYKQATVTLVRLVTGLASLVHALYKLLVQSVPTKVPTRKPGYLRRARTRLVVAKSVFGSSQVFIGHGAHKLVEVNDSFVVV